MINILIFLWVFILPILLWAGKFFLLPKQNNQQEGTTKKISMCGYFGLEIFAYLLGIAYIIWRYRVSSDFSFELKDFLYYFSLLQVGILDLFCLLFIIPLYCSKFMLNIWERYKLFFKSNSKDDVESFFNIFETICRFALSMMVRMFILFAVFLTFFHAFSIQDAFMEQKLPLIFMIFILLFNPIYMFYQLKERLFKND